MGITPDENNYGEEKVLALIKRIHRYRKKITVPGKPPATPDLSEIVLTSEDLTPNSTPTKDITGSEKQKYRCPLTEVSTRQKYRRTEEISNIIEAEVKKQSGDNK